MLMELCASVTLSSSSSLSFTKQQWLSELPDESKMKEDVPFASRKFLINCGTEICLVKYNKTR